MLRSVETPNPERTARMPDLNLKLTQPLARERSRCARTDRAIIAAKAKGIRLF
jgi:hypothetical protein